MKDRMREQQIALVLSQTTQPAAGGDIFWSQMFPLILMLGVFWYFLWRSQKRERQKFEQMLSTLKRNDRVITIGGLYGTVVEVRDNEVVLKVDESNNTKIRFTRSAIKEVLRDTSAAAAAAPQTKKS